jgi:hypothetical protein
MKQMSLKLFSLIFTMHFAFSQEKINSDLEIMLTLGRLPYNKESNSMSDDILRLLYYNIQSNDKLKIGYLNQKGEIIIEPKYNMGTDFYGEYANIIKDSTFGFVDKKGKEVLMKNFEKIFFYYGNTGIAKKDNKYGLINRMGDIVVDFKYKNISLFGSKNYLARNDDNESIILDSLGNIIFNKNLKFDIESYYFESDSSFIFQEKINGKYLKGLVNINEKIICEPKFDNIFFIDDEEFYCVYKDKKYGYINKKGKEIIPPIYEFFGEISEDLISVKKNGKWGFINRKNEIVIPFEYDEVKPFSEGLAFVKKGKVPAFIDKKNKVQFIYDFEIVPIPIFSENLVLFKRDGKYGFLNKKGKIKIPAIYDQAYPFINGLAYVELNGKAGYINSKEKSIIPIKFKQLWFINENMIRFAE